MRTRNTETFPIRRLDPVKQAKFNQQNPMLPQEGDHVVRWSRQGRKYEYFLVRSIDNSRQEPIYLFQHVFAPVVQLYRTLTDLRNEHDPYHRCSASETFFLVQGRRPYDYHFYDLVKLPGSVEPMFYREAIKQERDERKMEPVVLHHDKDPLPRFRERMKERGLWPQ